MATFRYQTLKSSGKPLIRLLVIKPAPSHDAPLNCQLITSRLTSTFRYDAISYTWDGQRSRRPVLLDGTELRVTQNVDSILRHLRRRYFERRIWVDSVCINQADLQEKREQLGHMAEIYRNARRVVIWLGEGQASTSRAIHYLKWKLPIYKLGLHLPFLRYRAKHALLGLRGDFQNALNLHLTPQSVHNKLNTFSGLHDIIQHRWFQRLWTLQEVSLARRAVLQCGHVKLSWRLLSNALTFDGVIFQPKIPSSVLFEGGYNPTVPVRSNPFLKRMHQVQALQEWVRRSRQATLLQSVQHRPPMAFIINLILTGINPENQVTEEVDRVYSLEGILQELGVGPLAPSHSLSGSTLPQIFRSTIISLALRFRSLDFLLYTTGKPWAADLPSWVPTHTEVPWGFGIPNSMPYNKEALGASNFKFHESQILELSGKTIDLITSVSPESAVEHQPGVDKPSALDSSHGFQSQVHRWSDFVRQRSASVKAGSVQENDVLFKLLVHPQVMEFYDRGNVPQRPWFFSDHRLVRHFGFWLRNIKSFEERLEKDEDSIFDLAEHFMSSERILASLDTADHSIGYSRALLLIRRWVRENIVDKSLVETSNGHIGIAWRSVLPGDELVVIKGLGTPLLLRPSSSNGSGHTYRLIGPCSLPMMPGMEFKRPLLGTTRQFQIV